MQLDFVASQGGFSGTAAPNVPGSQLYLSNKTDRYHSIYLYCSFSTDGKRGMIGIFPSWAPPGNGAASLAVLGGIVSDQCTV
jgi:hypothetical protein